MEDWQKIVLVIGGIFNFFVFLKGFHECKNKKNAYGLTPILLPFGIFAWGDAVIFGLFWMVVVSLCYLLGDWILFLLVISVFWIVRSLGETIYWFNQQFSSVRRNLPEKLPWYDIFQNDSVWYIYQIIWQCVTVASVITTIYLAARWMEKGL